ncbi:hypothetical protein [Nocardiopsis ansamitocini]|uniref:Secreted protein n=1 Tax=Nocardiopsis ansamitocini TaxID=1670832 RepID=A0A9W6PAH4_9ACTN|nr:hypothetical protein [Nocardiopsis ansamitocini]GLU50004.1 hypothetical protein Nans01_43550 [Nocardiopsis ansamitocini]
MNRTLGICTVAAVLTLTGAASVQAAQGEILLRNSFDQDSPDIVIADLEDGNCYNQSEDQIAVKATGVTNRTDRPVEVHSGHSCESRLGVVAPGETYERQTPDIESVLVALE